MIRRFFESTIIQQSTGLELNILDYNPAVWLDAQDASTITLVDNKVSLWSDKASGNNAIQSNAAMRPLYGLSVTSNGYPSIEITNLGSVGFSMSSPVQISEAIFLSAYKNGTETTFSAYNTFLQPENSSNTARIMGNSGSGNLFSGGGNLTSQVYKNNNTVSTDLILPLVFSVCNFRFASTLNTWTLLKSNFNTDRSLIGFTGEIILFENQLASQDRTDIINHLINKWGI